MKNCLAFCAPRCLCLISIQAQAADTQQAAWPPVEMEDLPPDYLSRLRTSFQVQADGLQKAHLVQTLPGLPEAASSERSWKVDCLRQRPSFSNVRGGILRMGLMRQSEVMNSMKNTIACILAPHLALALVSAFAVTSPASEPVASILAFGEAGKIKMLYDVRQRPQAVYLRDRLYIVYNGDAQPTRNLKGSPPHADHL